MTKELKVDRDRMLEAAKSCQEVERVFRKLWPSEFAHLEYGSVYKYGDHYFMVARVGMTGKALVGIKGGTPDCACWYSGVRDEQRVYSNDEFPDHLESLINKSYDIKYVGHIREFLYDLP